MCAPAPTACGAGGWYERVEVADPGASDPDPARTVPPPAPTCDDDGVLGLGCGCGAGGGAGGGVLAGLLALALGRRGVRAPA